MTAPEVDDDPSDENDLAPATLRLLRTALQHAATGTTRPDTVQMVGFLCGTLSDQDAAALRSALTRSPALRRELRTTFLRLEQLRNDSPTAGAISDPVGLAWLDLVRQRLRWATASAAAWYRTGWDALTREEGDANTGDRRQVQGAFRDFMTGMATALQQAAPRPGRTLALVRSGNTLPSGISVVSEANGTLVVTGTAVPGSPSFSENQPLELAATFQGVSWYLGTATVAGGHAVWRLSAQAALASLKEDDLATCLTIRPPSAEAPPEEADPVTVSAVGRRRGLPAVESITVLPESYGEEDRLYLALQLPDTLTAGTEMRLSLVVAEGAEQLLARWQVTTAPVPPIALPAPLGESGVHWSPRPLLPYLRFRFDTP